MNFTMMHGSTNIKFTQKGLQVELHAFLTSELVAVSGQLTTHEIASITHCIRGWIRHRTQSGGCEDKSLTLPGTKPHIP